MSHYLLDTNAYIAFLKNHPKLLDHIRAVGSDALFLYTPVKAELWFGACKSQRITENKDRLRSFFADLPSLPFDDEAAECFGEIRATLTRLGTPIGPYDLQIAAIALSRGLVVVTHNVDEFSRVPGLTVEDWLL